MPRPATPPCGRPWKDPAKGGVTFIVLRVPSYSETEQPGLDLANVWADKTIRVWAEALECRDWRDERVEGVSRCKTG